MILRPISVAFIAVCAIHAAGEDRGTCPPSPPAPAYAAAKKAAVASAPSSQSGDRIGTLTLLTVLSDKGYVCSAKVVQGLDKSVDAEAEKTVSTWRFSPAKKNGRAVPIVVVVQLNYRLDKDGHVIFNKPGESTGNLPFFSPKSNRLQLLPGAVTTK